MTRLRRVPLFALAAALMGTLLTAIATASPQVAPVVRTEYLVDVWDADNGLPGSAVSSLAVTPDGYLWIGTYDGVARFDGVRFTAFHHRDNPGLPDDGVTGLTVDSAGRLWAATLGGVASYDRGEWHSHPRQNGEPWAFVAKIRAGRDGHVYAASGGRIYTLEGDRFAAVPTPEGQQYLSVACDADGNLWAITKTYLSRARDGRWEQIPLPEGWARDGIRGAVAGRHHGIWIAVDDGIRLYRNGVWSAPRVLPEGFTTAGGTSLLEDSAGNLWAGDERSGLILFRPDGSIRRFGHAEGLPNLTIRALIEDPEGDVWVATDGGGMVRLRHRLATMFDESNGLSQTVVDSVVETEPGKLLVATYGGGILPFDTGTGRFGPPLPGISRDAQVMSLARGPDGSVWAGMFNGGLARIRGGRAETVAAVPPVGGSFRALFFDARGALWIGRDHGIASYTAGVFTDRASDPGAPKERIIAIAADAHGELWAGGTDGLFHLREGRWERFVPPGASGYANVTALYSDGQGSLWIGTRDGALDRLRDGRLTTYGTGSGLAATHIGGIVQDGDGSFWLATARQGLVAVTAPSLDRVAAGQSSQLDLIWVTREDGLATNEMRVGNRLSAIRGADGRLWFATMKGLALVDPRGMRGRLWQPALRIEGVNIAGHPLPFERFATGKLVVPPGSRVLRIAFTAPSFSDPERMRFQYRLEGLDAGWVDARERAASFGDLNPGRYTLRVRATNDDGIWSGKEAVLSLEIQPFYWETLWFRIALALALALLTGGLSYATQIRKLARERARRLEIERMQAILRISEERFSKAFDASPVPMCIFSLDTETYLNVNRQFQEHHATSRGDVVGRGRSEVNLWIDAEESARFTALARANGSVRNFEARLRGPNGELCYHLLASEQIELEGRPCILIAADDITERRRLEEQLHQARKLESVGRLAGGVAHDFNNLLTVINGYSDLILQQLDPADRNFPRIDQIRKAGGRAADLTRQLLAFSRKQVIKPKPVDMNRLVSETEPLLRRLLPESIEIGVRLSEEPVCVMADAGQLNQVLINLAANSRDAMLDGGQLIVEISAQTLDEQYVSSHAGMTAGPYVMLAVSDTGMGISDEAREHIFEPFFTTKKKGAGTGLGLATVYGIVRQSGGWIWVYSETGKGTTFKIYLPLIENQAIVRDLEEHPAGPRRGSETILVVEDQPAVRKLAREVLEAYGYRVLEAAHGVEALRIVDSHPGPIHLMLTDVVMPGMTGKELAGRLHAVRPLTKVLYMSGYTENVIAKQGVLDPGIAFIPKPLAPEALAAKVRETLGKKTE